MPWELARYRKRLPSANHTGQRWVVCISLFKVVTALAAPPVADTTRMLPVGVGANRIILFVPQLPPRARGASANSSTGPVSIGAFFNLPLEKKIGRASCRERV